MVYYDNNQIPFVFSLKKFVSNSILPLSLNNEMVLIFKYAVFYGSWEGGMVVIWQVQCWSFLI